MVKNAQDIDVNIIHFLRFLRKLGLLSKKTYLVIGEDLIIKGSGKKSAWRKANWKEYLKSG